jgi:hypothetical protein
LQVFGRALLLVEMVHLSQSRSAQRGDRRHINLSCFHLTRRKPMFDAQKLLNALAGGTEGHRDLSDAFHRGQQMASDTATQAASAVSGALGEAQSRLRGTAASDYAGKAKEIVDQNPVTTAAALGGLAALLLGTPRGRSVASGLIRMGGLAAIGALAYFRTAGR